MRLVVLPTMWTVLIDVAAWFVIHLGISSLVTLLPRGVFPPAKFPYRLFPFETETFYERWFAIRTWKRHLPDAGPWFGGFSKRSLRARSQNYLVQFIEETCRGEAAHWLIVATSPVFFLWNTAWVGWFMISFGLVFNLPCLLVQRYNRGRLHKIIKSSVILRSN